MNSCKKQGHHSGEAGVQGAQELYHFHPATPLRETSHREWKRRIKESAAVTGKSFIIAIRPGMHVGHQHGNKQRIVEEGRKTAHNNMNCR